VVQESELESLRREIADIRTSSPSSTSCSALSSTPAVGKGLDFEFRRTREGSWDGGSRSRSRSRERSPLKNDYDGDGVKTPRKSSDVVAMEKDVAAQLGRISQYVRGHPVLVSHDGGVCSTTCLSFDGSE
jgi:hypothetical protein